MLKLVLQSLTLLALGVLIYLLDVWELANPFQNEILLFVLSLLKSAYFINLTFRWIRKTLETEFYFHEFLSFILFNVGLIVLSYGIDYYCLHQINALAFKGVPEKHNILAEFITFVYFSIASFTTVGFGDILPNSTSAQVFVSIEIMLSFLFNVLIIANVVNIRDSLNKKQQHQKP